jgi:hypothetical protein
VWLKEGLGIVMPGILCVWYAELLQLQHDGGASSRLVSKGVPVLAADRHPGGFRLCG